SRYSRRVLNNPHCPAPLLIPPLSFATCPTSSFSIMSITFQLAPSISVELHDPSYLARCLVTALESPNHSLDDLMSTFFCFSPELVGTLQETDGSDPRVVFLATAVLRQFYNPALDRPTLDPILVEYLHLVIPVVVPVMLHALDFSTEPEMESYRPEDAVVLSTLAVLLEHEQGIVQFAQTESSRLAVEIRSIINMWIHVSGTTSITTIDGTILKIIRSLSAHRLTRGPLTEVLEGVPRSLFRRGLTRLNSVVGELDNPSFSSLPKRLLTNMRGLSLMTTIRPKLRAYLFGHELIHALCSLLAYAVVDRPRRVSPEEWATEKFSAYSFLIAICGELRVFFKDTTTSGGPIMAALNARLLESIYAALHHFGRARTLPCTPMSLLLNYIGEWTMKSQRVAHKVLVQLNGFRSSRESWDAMSRLPSNNALVKGWLKFVENFVRNVQTSPETGRLDTVCMKSSCNGRGKKRCQTCLVLIVCSEACFREMHASGEHTCRRV
ncbi:hypothetical protein CPB85DRAFT_1311727, partial [Mucidula mucida]